MSVIRFYYDMGGSASTISSNLSGKTIQKSQIDPFLLSLVNHRTDQIPNELQFYDIQNILKNKTDVFLTHNWGPNQANHQRVAEVNRALKARGLTTWFDDEKMEGNVKQKMVEGIDNASCVVVFITKQYIDKVGGPNPEDNCQLEFGYSARRKTSKRMVPVVMEPEVRDTSSWSGEVGMVLGGLLYVDLCSDLTDSKVNELHERIMSVIHVKLQDAFERCYQSIMSSSSGGGSGSATNSELHTWLVQTAKLAPVSANECTAIFLNNKIGSVDRLMRRYADNNNLLRDLNIDQYDAEDIAKVLNAASPGKYCDCRQLLW